MVGRLQHCHQLVERRQVAAFCSVDRLLGEPVPGHIQRIVALHQRAALVARARALLARGFLAAVFLSRWLVSPAGPWVNLAAGAAGHGWARFTAAGVAGELVWVGLYTGMGHLFVGNLQAAEDLIGSLLGLVGGAAAMVLAGLWLRAAMRHRA